MPKIATTCKKEWVHMFGVDVPENYEIEYINFPCPDEDVIKACDKADFLWVSPVDPISDNVLNNIPSVKLIQMIGVGYDKVNLDLAKEKNIYICNNPGVNAVSVAEHALGLILATLKRTAEADAKIKSDPKRYMESFEDYRNEGHHELSSRTVGLIGLGNIGKHLAKLLKGFGCTVKYNDIIRDEKIEQELGIQYTTLEDIFKTCNVISIHVPVTDSTRGLINDESIAMMQKDTVLINVARGEIIDDEALKKALEDEKLYVSLDVLAPEPPGHDHPLLNLSPKAARRITHTPHIGGTSNDAFARMQTWSYENMAKVLAGEKPNNIKNGL